MGTISADRETQLIFAPGESWTVNKYVFVIDTGAPAVFSAVANCTLKNFGIIRGATAGVAFDEGSAACVIRNGATGVISSPGGNGIRFDGDGVTITNAGGIIGSINGVRFGVDAVDMVLNNSGDIIGNVTGVYEFSNHDGGVIRNSGLIRGGNYGVDVYTAAGLTTAIDNHAGGTIEGSINAIWTRPTAGKLSLDNAGRIKGSVSCTASANDAIVNKGTITGETHLGPGNDRFTFAGGKQGTVFGEAGADKFAFKSEHAPDTNAAKIGDFTPGTDTIELSKALFDGIGSTGALKSKYFVVGTKAKDADDHIIYDEARGKLYYDEDGNGAGQKALVARLDGAPDLHASDVIVVA